MSEDTNRDSDAAIARLLRLAGPRAPLPEATTARVKAAIRDRWQRSVRSRRRRRFVLAGLSTAALLALAIVFLQRRDTPPLTLVGRAEGGGALFAGAEVETGEARGALTLESGASLRLDVDTRLRLVSSRELFLERGAIYADTGGGTSGALTVVTELGRVTDVGTRFEVRRGDSRVLVRVREGAVRFQPLSGASREAGEGTEIEVTSAGHVSSRPSPAFGPTWAWVLEANPGFDIEGRKLGEFLEWVARETGWSVHFVDASLEKTSAEIVLHGSVDGLTPEEALEAVLPTCGLEHRFEEGVLSISKSR